jgi:hypothetical protein
MGLREKTIEVISEIGSFDDARHHRPLVSNNLGGANTKTHGINQNATNSSNR